MLCTLLLVRASQMALMASSVKVPLMTPQSWLESKLRSTTHSKWGNMIPAGIQRFHGRAVCT
eukprot:5260779-Prymnesium_polylepis.1